MVPPMIFAAIIWIAFIAFVAWARKPEAVALGGWIALIVTGLVL